MPGDDETSAADDAVRHAPSQTGVERTAHGTETAGSDDDSSGRGDRSERASSGPEALEAAVLEALRNVVDPEIRLDVVTLGLIRGVVLHEDETEVQMILTTPFCPYGGMLVQQVKDITRSVVSQDVRVTMLDEPWSPDLIEGADLAEWGLM